MPLPLTYASGQEQPIATLDEAQEVFDILDVMEAMSAHFKEKHEAIMQWSWKLFCRKWARLMKWAYEERERKAKQEQDRAFDELQARG